MTVLIIFLGSGIGGVLRYTLGNIFEEIIDGHLCSTLLCNLAGSFIIGLLCYGIKKFGAFEIIFTNFLMIGILGGFTTFSSFSLDAIKLLNTNPLNALFYIISSVLGSLIFCGIGFYIGRLLFFGRI